MNNFYKGLTIIFLGGFLGAVLMTWFAPRIIELFLTPPVSFGVNCEPAAVYSMQKLILCQIIGIVSGSLLFLLIKIRFFGPKPKVVKNETTPQGPTGL